MLHRLLLVEVANYKVIALISCICLLSLVGLFVYAHHRGELGAVSLVLALVAAADVVNTHYGYLPQVADVVGANDWHTVPLQEVLQASPGLTDRPSRLTLRTGGVVSLNIDGTSSGFGRRHVLVELPPQYFTEPTRRFAVVYLLHGSPGRPEDWLRAGRLLQVRQLAANATPMIFVMPPMSRGWLDDSECVDSTHERVETWLVSDVVQAIDSLLRTQADRSHRAVAGTSAGGYCALNLAVRHSSLFGVALDMSGYTEPTHDGGLRHLFGARWRQDAAANTPADYLAGHAVVLPLRIRFDVGTSDHRPLREINRVIPVLRERGVSAFFVERSGGHTYHVWVPALRDGLVWLASQFAQAS